jgi:hypothetical protein
MGGDYDAQLADGFSDTTYPFPEQILPLPEPLLTSATLFQTNLQFNATCLFGGNFNLLCSTNLMAPLTQWTSVLTNSVVVRGTNNFSVTLTNAVNSNPGQRYYILQSQ